MAQPVNLNRVRKQRARDAKKARADENAARFGRSKAAREADRARRDKAARDLDGHKREG
ncbi:DUF4169 family protein [Pontibaca salina]|uniref:DUF4169 family protein n=1 Tax=Pontibaca salina TaxID=2795731 RepID=A0A934HKW3_9RHOB|nr:DUF4169 family protein [Pontibaca salina]MBI6628741.1 DUF4169 family protein [Pontibaca salina]